MTRKFIGFFRLVDACGASGCPACRCIDEDSRRHLESLIGERVTDPQSRRALRAAWGLCNRHTWMLADLDLAATGVAIIYEDLLRVGGHRVERLRDRGPAPLARLFGRLRQLAGARAAARPRLVERYRRRHACPVCTSSRDAEARYLDTLLRFADDPELTRAYAGSAGLCLPHTIAVVDLGTGAPGIQRLLTETLQKWQALRDDLAGFVAKHEYRSTASITEREATARAAAFEVMAGARSVFGA